MKKQISEFQKELKKTTNTALIAAIGLILALTWKDVITAYIDKITVLTHLQNRLLIAIIITVICAFLIYIIPKVFSSEK